MSDEKPKKKMLTDNLDAIPEIFTNGFRGILLLRRNKDRNEGNAQRKAIKRISRNTAEWKSNILEFREMQKITHVEYCIYSSVNSRNMRKAIHEFQRRLVENQLNHEHVEFDFFCDIQHRFFSCLMNPACRDQDHFILDCDSEKEYTEIKAEVPSDVFIYEYPTENGMHIITKPFVNFDIPLSTVKQDALMYIG